MHCILMQCDSVSTWKPQPRYIAPHGEPSPPSRPHTDPHLRNGYDVHLADDDTMSVGMPDMDMEKIPGVHATVSHFPDSYINAAKKMVETVDTQCHTLGSTQGSDQPTQPTIKERSVADSDTFGEC